MSLHQREEVDRLFETRNEIGRALANIETCVDETIQGFRSIQRDWLHFPTTEISTERKMKKKAENNSLDIYKNVKKNCCMYTLRDKVNT